jgi:hypothetical protein
MTNDDTFTIVEHENKFREAGLVISKYPGLNTENFCIKKESNNKRLMVSFFIMNGVYYVNLNGCHILDYKRFSCIQQISQEENNIKIKNVYFGHIVIANCDVDMMHKALLLMADYVKGKQSILKDILYFIFN